MKTTVTAKITIGVGFARSYRNVEIDKQFIPSVIGYDFYVKIFRLYMASGKWSQGIPTFVSVRFLDKTIQVL